MRFHLSDAAVARHAADRLRGALKQRGHARTHTKRLAAVAAMLGYTNWTDLLAHCPSDEPPSPFDEELNSDALNRRLQYQTEALARAAHVPRHVACEVVAELRPTARTVRTKTSAQPVIEDIVLERIVPGGHEQTFSHFVHDITRWWPTSFTFSLEEMEAITIEPRRDGRWYETSSAGDEIDWGVVTSWEPNLRVALTFQLSATRTVVPREQASSIAVDFAEHESGCTVRLTHSHIYRHGADAAIIRTNMASEHGWPFILDSFCRRSRATSSDAESEGKDAT